MVGAVDLVDTALDWPIRRLADRLEREEQRRIADVISDVMVHFVISRGATLSRMFQFEELVERNINQTPSKRVEEMVRRELAGKAFVAIEVLGGVLGGLAGALLFFIEPSIGAWVQSLFRIN